MGLLRPRCDWRAVLLVITLWRFQVEIRGVESGSWSGGVSR